MNHPKNDSNREDMFARIFHRIEMLRKHKDDLLNILNDLEGVGRVISKINQRHIITKVEHNLLKKFIEIRGLHTDISSVYDQVTLSCNKEGTFNDLNSFNNLVEKYPFVMDVDEVREDISSKLGEGIAEIWKNENRGLVKKTKGSEGQDEIKTLFDYNHSQFGVLTFSPEEYAKCGLIEVRNHHDDRQDIMFLRLMMKHQEKVGSIEYLGKYTMIGGFDRDNIGFSYKSEGDKGEYIFSLIHKDISPKGIKIYEIGSSFKSMGYQAKQGFDGFNTFEAWIGKNDRIILKKSYNHVGELNGIYTFKKKRFGGEEPLRAREKGIEA